MSKPIVALVLCLFVAGGAGAVVPNAVPNLPVLEAETAIGSIVSSAETPISPTPKVVDGNIDDWTGASTRLGGMSIYSHGELVYQDYLGDAWGADDGYDAQRLATLDALNGAEPRTYRADPLQQAAGDQFGAPQPIGAALHYGDAALTDDQRNSADIEEVRMAADADNVYFLVRTLGDPTNTAVMLLFDTEPGGSYVGLGGITSKAEWRFVVDHDAVVSTTYKEGGDVGGCLVPNCPLPPWSVASNATGDANSVEIRLARSTFDEHGGLPSPFGLGVATGVADANGLIANVRQGDAKSDLVNVAFRHEPARIWMDKSQALALRDGNIDRFSTPVDLGELTGGETQSFTQRPGYYEAIYEDATSPVDREQTINDYYQGAFQHYGLYLPAAWRPAGMYPATFWMHYRGGHAHDAAAWEPGILREFGDEPSMIVVTPSARGTSSWYTGRGMVDFLDVWNDVMHRYAIDRDRVYLAGHSMGGWASYLLGLLMPDRWAAANPEDGLVVPGLWTGVGDPSDSQNGADVKAEFLYNILQNAYNLPYAILHGTEDELVPVTSADAVAAQFAELHYRFRLYQFHAYEHYSAPIWDDWRDIVRYMTGFRRDAQPQRVKYRVWPALDHAVSTISVPDGVDLGLHFDGAYWVSGLQTSTEGIEPSNIGEIDASTSGRGSQTYLPIPEAGTGGQPEPYTMIGQRWLNSDRYEPANSFFATLTNLKAATLDVAGMGLGTAEPMTGVVQTDSPSDVHLRGVWSQAPVVSGASSSSYDAGLLTLHFDAQGSYNVTIVPA